MTNWYASNDILHTTFSLITYVSKNLWSWKFTKVCFLTKEIQKNDIKIALESTGFELYENAIKVYHSLYISVKEKDVAL